MADSGSTAAAVLGGDPSVTGALSTDISPYLWKDETIREKPKNTEDYLNAISPSGTLSALSGIGAANASEDALKAQLKASDEALQTLLGDLAPFKELGTSQIPSIAALSGNRGAQDAFMANNPVFDLQRNRANELLTDNRSVGGLSFGAQEALNTRFEGQRGKLNRSAIKQTIAIVEYRAGKCCSSWSWWC